MHVPLGRKPLNCCGGCLFLPRDYAQIGHLPVQIYAPAVVQSRVAYQGVPGAYSESAARKACPEAEPLPCDQFEVAFQALAQWLADTAVLPIENSLGGSIHTVFDLLIRSAPQSMPAKSPRLSQQIGHPAQFQKNSASCCC